MITPIIIQGCLHNDRRSQRLLYEACYPLMMKISSRYCQNQEDAADTVNTSFLKILKSLTKEQNIETFYGWVKQITVRTSIDHFRAKKTYNTHNVFSIDNENSRAHYTLENIDYTESKLATNEIYTLINELPDTCKAVLNMVTMDGFTHKETAEILGISEENSRWHLSKARKLMTEKLQNLQNKENYRMQNVVAKNVENGK